MITKVNDYGFYRMQQYNGSNRTGKYSFYKKTANPNVTIWITPTKSGKYHVQKSTNTSKDNYDLTFDIQYITEFDNAVKAQKWVNKENAHIFEGMAVCI
jgi:hypothetical protein